MRAIHGYEKACHTFELFCKPGNNSTRWCNDRLTCTLWLPVLLSCTADAGGLALGDILRGGGAGHISAHTAILHLWLGRRYHQVHEAVLTAIVHLKLVQQRFIFEVMAVRN